MAKQFFKDLPDTSTPLTASRLNGLLDGEEAMGNLVVDSIRTKNMFDSSTIVQRDIANAYPDIRMTSRQVLWLEPGTYTFSTNLGSSYQFGIQVQNVGTLPLSTWPSTFIYSTNWLATGTTTHTFTTTTAGWFNIMLRKSDNGAFTSTDITNLKGYNYQLETGEDATTYSPYQNLTNSLDAYYELPNCKLYKMGNMVFAVVYTGSTAITNGIVDTLPAGFRCNGTVRTFTRYYTGSAYENGLLFVQGNQIQINTEFGQTPASASFIRTIAFWETQD